MSGTGIDKIAEQRPVVGKVSSDEHGQQFAPDRDTLLNLGKNPPRQNEMYDCGYAQEIAPRCAEFGVLPFSKKPEALWGGTPIHKGFDSTGHQNQDA